MNQLYEYTRTSKQNFHQRFDRMLALEEMKQQLIPVILEIRKDHPRMSARQMYFKINPAYMGRDRFEAFAHDYGFKLDKVKNWRKTTDSLGVRRFPNLIEGIKLNDINQVWVSDITYYELNNRFYYITFIMDLHSRFLLACHLSRDLRTISTTIPAIKKALLFRKGCNLNQLIFHSDGGGQYYCKEFLQITKHYGISNSMAEIVFENPHIERVHRTIKNDYLIPYGPEDEQQLRRDLSKAVNLYNYDKPHGSLSRSTPYEFENINKHKQYETTCLPVFQN